MKKSKYILTTILLSLSLCTEVSAKCTEEMKQRFKEIEKKYTITRSFDEKTQEYVFTYHMPKSLYFEFHIESETGVTCVFKDPQNAECRTKDLKKKQNFIIKGKYSSCDEELKKESAVTATEKKEVYNKYSESKLCEGIEEFVLCQKDYSKELTEDEFKKRVETYKNSQTKKEENNNIEVENSKTEQQEENTLKKVFDKVFDYIKGHIVVIGSTIALIILTIITIILNVKSIKKSRRLE